MRYLYSTIAIVILFLTLLDPCHAQLSEQENAVKNNAYFYLQQQNYQQALNSAKKLPASYDKYLLMGITYLHQDQLETALEWTDKGLNQFPDSLKLSVTKIEILFFQDHYSKMLETFHQVEQKVNKETAKELGLEKLTPKVSYAYQKNAREAFKEKKFAVSEGKYLKALQYEKSQEVYMGLCLSLLEQEKWNDLIQYASKGLDQYPRQSQMMGLLANAYFKVEDYKSLQKIYKDIYEADNQNLQKALTLGEVMMANQDFNAAQKHYNTLLTRFPENPMVYDAALQISLQYRDINSRAAILEQKYEHIPTVETAMKLAETYQLGNNWNKAIGMYDSLSKKHDKSLAYDRELVKAYQRADSLVLNTTRLKELSTEYPQEEIFSLAYLKAIEKQSCKHKAEGIQAVKLDQNSAVLTQKARLLASCNKEEKAIYQLQKAIVQDAVAPDTYVLLTKMTMNHKNLKDSSFGYLKQAATHLLSSIEEDEQLLNNLSLSDPFNSVWLDIPNISDGLEKHKNQLEEMIGLASRQFKLAKTEELLKNLTNDYNDNALLMFLSGQHYSYHRQKNEAMAYYKKAIETEPDLLQAQYEWARLSEKSEEDQAAKMGYEKVLAIDDQYTDAYQGLIRLYRKTGDLEKLTDRWELIYSNNRNNKVLKNALIEALHKQGKVEEAKTFTQYE